MRYSALVTGGARSGKSQFAENLTKSLGENPVYIATAAALDPEMTDRIARHRAQRGTGWTTIEEPLNVAEILRQTDDTRPRLVDCLTLWLSNLMLGDLDWMSEVDNLIGCVQELRAPVVFVTNETGWGIVPETALGRSYRDASGIMNQRVAAIVETVDLVVCGIAVSVKSASPRHDQ